MDQDRGYYHPDEVATMSDFNQINEGRRDVPPRPIGISLSNLSILLTALGSVQVGRRWV